MKMIETSLRAVLAVAALLLLPAIATAQPMPGAGEFKIGDRVEVDVTGSKRFFERGVITEFRRDDMYNGRPKESGYFWRVRLDSMDPDEEGRIYKAADMRLLTPTPVAPPAMPPAGNAGLPPVTPGLPPVTPGMPPITPGAPPMNPGMPPAGGQVMAGAGEFKIGDRVEVDVTGSKRFFERGTIVEYRKNDMYNGRSAASGYFWRVRLDSMDADEEGRVFKAADMRPIGQQMQVLNILAVTGFFDEQATGTVMADRPIEKCPVDQKQVARNAKPDTAVIAKLIKCLWEAPSAPGMDGALTVDLTPLKVGQPRRWNRLTDIGNGNLDTMVFPIQTDYTWKTFYRTQTRVLVSRGIFNCYVNTLSEWQCGLGESKKISEETIKKPATPPRGAAN